jgi:cytochrome P450
MSATSPAVEGRGAPPVPAGRRPASPPVLRSLGLTMRMLRDRVGVMADASARYGDAVKLYLGPKPMYLFNHPDLAKHVLADNAANYHKGVGLHQAKRVLGEGLLTSEGEIWRRQRRTIQPVFQARRIAGQADALAQEAGALVERWRGHVGGEPIDVREEMTALTMGVLGRTLLDVDLTGFTGIGHDFEAVQEQAMFEVMSLNMIPAWLPLPAQLRFRRARTNLRRITQELVRHRQAHPTADGDDVLSRLIGSAAQDPDQVAARERSKDELVTLLLAGHETTASTLSWAFHMLDRNPEVRRRVRDEALEVLGPDRLPAYDDLTRLTYTGMVVQEVMRLYPAVWMLARKAQSDDEVGGYHVPAGTDVVVSPWALHRNREFWPDPERFDPERFSPEATGSRPSFTYLPFGAGPRFCIGTHLGSMEAIFVLAMVGREFALVEPAGSKVRPEAMLSLRVRGGLPMLLRGA